MFDSFNNRYGGWLGWLLLVLEISAMTTLVIVFTFLFLFLIVLGLDYSLAYFDIDLSQYIYALQDKK